MKILFPIFVYFFFSLSIKGQVIYVNVNASGANTGMSWTDAYNDLQSGLTSAVAGSEIWVATGIYKPTSGIDRTISFSIKDKIKIYGGFTGVETQQNQRNYIDYPTTLSGDIGIIGDSTDNSYHIIYRSLKNDTTTLLDGFIIRDGNASSTGVYGQGAGYYISQGNMTIQNCSFVNNHAGDKGGAVYINNGFLNIIHCTFINNKTKNGSQGRGGAICHEASGISFILNCEFINNYSEFAGGAIYNSKATKIVNSKFSGNYSNSNGGAIFDYSDFGSRPNIINNEFNGNQAKDQGGAIYNYGHSNITNCTFTQNIAYWGVNGGGAIYNYNGTHNIINCIIWNNTGGEIYMYTGTTNVKNSIIKGGYSGIDVNNSDPLFIDSDGLDNVSGNSDDDLHVQLSSPAIDAGIDDTSGLLLPAIDLDSNSRIQNGRIDMGVYESSVLLDFNNIFYNNTCVFPNPACEEITITLDNINLINDWNIKICNSIGQIVKSDIIISEFKNEIKINDLPSGIYNIIFVNNKREISFVKKLVVD